MIEIAIYYLIGLAIALISLGIGIGYKIAEKKNDVKSEEFFCELALFSQPNVVNIVYKNGKKNSTNCSSYIEQGKMCILTNDKCIIFNNFDYKVKYTNIIQSLKNNNS